MKLKKNQNNIYIYIYIYILKLGKFKKSFPENHFLPNKLGLNYILSFKSLEDILSILKLENLKKKIN
jgi:hypothetical protein